MISNKIVGLYKERRMTLEELAVKIGMSKTGLHNALKANDLKISTLTKIAEELKIPIEYFFTDIAKSVEEYEKVITDLQESLNRYDLQCNYLEERYFELKGLFDYIEPGQLELLEKYILSCKKYITDSIYLHKLRLPEIYKNISRLNLPTEIKKLYDESVSLQIEFMYYRFLSIPKVFKILKEGKIKNKELKDDFEKYRKNIGNREYEATYLFTQQNDYGLQF